MALPSCPTCKNHLFRVSENAPSGASFKIMLVSCASCGTVVGTMDYFAVGSLVKQQDEVLKQHSQKLNSIEHTLQLILSKLR